MSGVFEEVQQQNDDNTDGLELDIAFQSSRSGVVRGISIEVEYLHAPLFISCDQLRRLADEAEQA